MDKILTLKNRMWKVERNADETLTLINEDNVIEPNTGSIIASLGGIEATLLRCLESADDFEVLISRKQEQQQLLKELGRRVAKEGKRCDVGSKRFATLDGKFYKFEQSVGWISTREDTYLAAIESRKIDKQKEAVEEKVYQNLVMQGPIPVNVDNLRIVMRHLQRLNWGVWELPQMTINYSANQYDCDGRTAVTIKLDEPIIYDGEQVSMFKYGAPRGHLLKYTDIKKSTFGV